MSIDMQSAAGTVEETLDVVFGSHQDPMALLEVRARKHLQDERYIVWECDASTFIFSYVSHSVEDALGWPRRRWTEEPTFWADVVVHPADRDESVAYCVAETGACRDHDFDYRALTSDGRVRKLRDYVRVVPGPDGRPERLRGVMIVVGED